MSTPYRVTTTFWDHATIWSDDESLAGHTTDGGRIFGITRTRYAECDRYGCSPVAVIAYDDREQVERFSRKVWLENDVRGPAARFDDRVQAALREFANPTPPKPAEPTGLGAVVVDHDGSVLVRVGTDQDSTRPWRATGGHRFSWDDVDHLTTLSEGAEPMADWEIDFLRGAL